MKNFIKLLSLSAALICLCGAVLSCKDANTDAETDADTEFLTMPEYGAEELGSYVKPVRYEGLTVTAREGETAQAALWRYIVDSAEITEYPAEGVEYYVSQERAKYRYFAKRDGIEYEELLEALGITEESMRERARALLKDDLVLAYIINDASISLTQEEKALHKDKYAEMLVGIYGYDAEYIKKNMSEQIYDAMLSDKTMEYLLSKNTVLTK